MSKPRCYLSAKMSGLDPEVANAWRLKATEFLEENFNVFNPCIYYNFSMSPLSYTEEEVKQFDLWNLKHSDIVLVNLDYPDSIGTAIELHMAHDEWEIPVIGYGGKDLWIHPWMKLCITKRCDMLEDAVNYINGYYLPNL